MIHHPSHPHSLLLILIVAAIAPLFNELPIRLRLPLVVMELLLGIAIGPHGLNLADAEGAIPTLSALGLSFLFFLAGLELDFSALLGRPLQLGLAGWVLSILLALAMALGLTEVGIGSDPLLIAVALSTTAIGTLLPILRDAGDLDSPFGRLVLGAGAIGEFGPIIQFSLIITSHSEVGLRSGLLVTFVVIALACAALILRVRPPRVVALLARSLHATSQLPIRLAVLLLGGMVVLADALGLNLLLGAFAAGALVGLVSRGPEAEPFRHKLDALSFGFFVPIFFVASGTQVDLPALVASTESLLRVPLFLVLLLAARGLPVLLYRGVPARDRLALALYSATSLPLIVVIAQVGKVTGHIEPANAAALVGAAILSVLIFPLTALILRGEKTDAAGAEPEVALESTSAD